ncbi:hypothetical protein KM043_012596 [Ampulex compressa]|nr:hypothetical protein KM043_012596 [Ampulex compressa]
MAHLHIRFANPVAFFVLASASPDRFRRQESDLLRRSSLKGDDEVDIFRILQDYPPDSLSTFPLERRSEARYEQSEESLEGGIRWCKVAGWNSPILRLNSETLLALPNIVSLGITTN